VERVRPVKQKGILEKINYFPFNIEYKLNRKKWLLASKKYEILT
jgi:hypothetical protein